MTQADVMDILREQPTHWFTREEIQRRTGTNLQSIYRNLLGLRKTDYVELKIVHHNRPPGWITLYRYKGGNKQ